MGRSKIKGILRKGRTLKNQGHAEKGGMTSTIKAQHQATTSRHNNQRATSMHKNQGTASRHTGKRSRDAGELKKKGILEKEMGAEKRSRDAGNDRKTGSIT